MKTTPSLRSRTALLSTVFACAGALLLGACAVEADDPEELTGEDAEALSCTNPSLNNTRSLFVTDPAALAKFPFKTVMDTIIATAGTGAQQSALQLYQQWWDLNNDTATARTTGPHCNDIAQPFDCPRQEGVLATTNPFTGVGTNPDSYLPIGLVNRFDLAPTNGANCGEYRVVFGKVSGLTKPNDRNLIIFEAKLPNPSPSLGIAACKPVAKFWADLSTEANANIRATKLQKFYFTGLTGFRPVIHFSHYRGTAVDANSGQIRTNQFMNRVSGQNWGLREYKLTKTCAIPSTCTLVMNQSQVKINPLGSFFAQVAPGGALTPFQTDFVNNQVPRLLGKSVSAIGMVTPAEFNGFQSDAQAGDNDYGPQLPTTGAFNTAIQKKLTALKSNLTPRNVVDRATTQSCAGCHELSTGMPLGGGFTWPSSNGFTQISEARQLSPALAGADGFLANRKSVLIKFLCTPPAPSSVGASSVSPSAEISGALETLGGSVNE